MGLLKTEPVSAGSNPVYGGSSVTGCCLMSIRKYVLTFRRILMTSSTGSVKPRRLINVWPWRRHRNFGNCSLVDTTYCKKRLTAEQHRYANLKSHTVKKKTELAIFVLTKMTKKMQLSRIIYCSLTALHVSSDIFAHHQEHHNCIYSFWYYPRM